MQATHRAAVTDDTPAYPSHVYFGYCLPENAFTDPDHRDPTRAPTAHAIEKLRSIVNNFSDARIHRPFTASLVPGAQPPVHLHPLVRQPNSTEVTLHFKLPDDSSRAVAVKVDVKYGTKITFTAPFEGMRFLHTSRPLDEQTFNEIMGNDPVALTLTKYTVQTFRVRNLIVLNLVQSPTGQKYAVFVAKSKREAATFLDEAFDTSLRDHYKFAKSMQRLGHWDSDQEDWSSDSDSDDA